MPRQFIACKFRADDARTYTYANDGEPVRVGDEVKAPDRKGDGWTRVIVAEVDVATPTKFTAKAILGLAPPREPKAEEGATDAG